MPRRKRPPKPKPSLAEDLPKNPEFQEFAEFTKKLLQVPKEEIDRRVKEAEEKRKRN